MSQVTIYLDDESLRKIEAAAALEKSSLSKWVKATLMQSLENRWPANFSSLFGSLSEHDLPNSSPLDFSQDSPRESF
jgi:hypothetical protein